MSVNDYMSTIENIAKQKVGEIHTALPGEIISFDATTCIATVKPTLLYFTTDGERLEYPLITGVPIFMPRAGNAQITYPVKSGDKCLIVFSERSIDEWMGKGSADNHDPRQFDLTDGFAFVGMCPAQSISADNVELINNGTVISVTPANTVNIIGDVNIKGNVNISGNTNVDGNYSCKGTSRMSGSITCDGDVTADGISLHSHTHTCPHGGNTSGPQ